MKIHDVKQGSDEWFSLRKGKMTASHAQEIGNNGKGLDTYVLTIMAEQYSNAEKEQFSNEHTERGNELEDQARSIYSFNSSVVVYQVGFVEYNDFAGSSPDGLMEKKGLEIKCPADLGYFKILLNGEDEIDTKYIWQCQMNMLVCEKDEWDIAFYNPNFTESIKIFTIKKDQEMQEKLIKGLEIGGKKIKEIKEKLCQKN